MNLYRQFEVLSRKQLAIEEGINLLGQARFDLQRSRASADRWGEIAITANVLLVPLNCIINSFDLKAAKSVYETLVRQLYGHYSKSGTRLHGAPKTILSLVKQTITEELKRKALTDYVAGVNILVGFAEDSIAVWQTQQLVDSGGKEMDKLCLSLDRKIDSAIHQLNDLGRKNAEIYERMEKLSRTS